MNTIAQHWINGRWTGSGSVLESINPADGTVVGVRRARYRGLPKVRLQHAFSATALNVVRLDAWWTTDPLRKPRTSRLERLSHRLAGSQIQQQSRRGPQSEGKDLAWTRRRRGGDFRPGGPRRGAAASAVVGSSQRLPPGPSRAFN